MTYQFHDDHFLEQVSPDFFSITDYTATSADDQFLWSLAKEDAASHPYGLADFSRELQLALELGGNLDAPETDQCN